LTEDNLKVQKLKNTIVGHGKYKILQKLGEGDFGVTYLANEIEYGTQVAIKILKDNDIPNWKNEARRAITLRGVPQIAMVIEADEEDIVIGGETISIRYIVSEYVEGKPLSQVLRGTPVSTEMIVDLTEEICRAIGHMQRRKLQHGDLNLDNIFLLPPDELDPAKRHTVKIIDFGLTRTKGKKVGATDLEDLKNILLECWNLNQSYGNQPLPSRDKKFHDLLSNLINRMEDPIVEQRISDPRTIIDEIYQIKHESSFTKSQEAKILSNPFEFLNVEQIPEDSDLIEYLYEDSVPWLKQITSFGTMVVSGPRGSGKSMILKNMRLLTKLNAGNFDVQSLSELKYFGFYLHCHKNLYLPFAGYVKYDAETLENLFHCLNLAFTAEILEVLITLENQKYVEIGISQKNNLREFLVSNVLQSDIVVLNPDSILSQLKSMTEKEILFSHLMIKENKSISKKTSVGFLNSLIEIMDKNFELFKSKQIYFLLDDYSAPKIPLELQKSINRIIGFRNERFCFKISTEKFYFETTDLDGKVLQQDREYSYVDLGANYINFDKPERERFVKNIIQKRLKRAKIKLSTDNFFGKSDGKSVAISLIDDKKNKKSKLMYGGFKSIYRLCMGDISTMLQLCNDLFTTAESENENPREEGISKKLQNIKIRNFAKNRLDTIKEIPQVGEQLYQIIETFGNISSKYLHEYWRENKTVKYQEVIRIELTENTNCLSEDAQELFRKLITEHIFLDAGGTHDWVKMSKMNPQLHLRPIFTPALRISYTSRYKLRMNCEKFEQFLINPQEYSKSGTQFLRNISGLPGKTIDDFLGTEEIIE